MAKSLKNACAKQFRVHRPDSPNKKIAPIWILLVKKSAKVNQEKMISIILLPQILFLHRLLSTDFLKNNEIGHEDPLQVGHHLVLGNEG